MKTYEFTDKKGSFTLSHPEHTSYLYFPIANESGVKSSVTPYLGGDFKTSQNTFLLQPVSSEELHNNKSTRNFWCYVEGKEPWSATGMSSLQQSKRYTGEEEEVSLTAGVLWHSISRKSKELGIESNILSFTPVGDEQVEIMKVDIINIGEEDIQMTATAAIPLYCRSADNIRDHRHVTSLLHRVRTTEQSVQVQPTLTFDERGHQKNQMIYYVSGCTGEGTKPKGFFPTVETFLGEGGSYERPEAVVKNLEALPSGSVKDGYEAIGGIRFETVRLQPREKKTFIILMGLGSSMKNIEDSISEYNTTKKVEKAYEDMKRYWDKKVNVSYETSDEAFDNFMYWVNVQPILRRIYGCSFLPHHDYGKGGKGWRDLWQDCLALLIMNPSVVRQMLIDNFGGVRIDGTNATIIGEKQGEFIADRNNITRVWMDHGFWPLVTTDFYIQQTGDIEILLKENTYFKDRQVVRGEEMDELWEPDHGKVLKDKNNQAYRGTLLEHLLVQNLTAFYDVGEHNHIRLRGADWNDALDMAEKRGESVAFTGAYAGNFHTLAHLLRVLKEKYSCTVITIAKEMEVLLKDDEDFYNNANEKRKLLLKYGRECRNRISGDKIHISLNELIDNLEHKAQWIQNHIRETEWITVKEHSWFNGYYDNHGKAVEGEHPLGVRMMLTSQVFAIMSGTATKQQVMEITKAADCFLYDKRIGGYRLNTDFKEVKDDLGRMFGFAYGHKENGAVFSHMAVMYANALYKRGFVKEGYKVIDTLYRHVSKFEVSKIYPGIPEYFNEDGRGMYHYLTGAASWLMLTVITEMYGVKGVLGDLYFEPKLMREQFDKEGKASIQMDFLGKKINVIYYNYKNKEYGEYKISGIKLNQIEQKGCEKKNGISKEILQQLANDFIHEIVVSLE